MGALKLFQTKFKELFSPKKRKKKAKVAKNKPSHLKLADKAKHQQKGTVSKKNSSADKVEIERLQSLIQNKIQKNSSDAKKAAMIIEKMIHKKSK